MVETVAKKNPKTTIIKAPNNVTGTVGISQIKSAITKLPIRTNCIGKSMSVLSSVFADFPNPLIDFEKVFTISGKDFNKLIIPPVATAPAPMYLM